MLASSEVFVNSVYVHVPFCAQKCHYCAFFSEPASAQTIQRYVNALLRELDLVAAHLKPTTIFFGGGTPSLLTSEQWAQLGRAMERMRLLGAHEWTIECNPATVSEEKAQLWRRFGVNRISLGVQSFDPELLDRLGRIHTRQKALETFALLRDNGFENINLDLIFGIPGQTLDTWRETLDEALALGSEHLSCYELTYEDDTPFFNQLKAGRFSVDEDLACAMYAELLVRAERAGLPRYEVSNFARSEKHGPAPEAEVPAYACRHNVNYWRGQSYYGFGPSAVSYVGGVREKNCSNTQLYCERLEQRQRPIDSREELPPLQRAGELAAFGLRMTAGWPFAEFHQRTGYDLRLEWKAELEELQKRGWGKLDHDRFRLTSRGLRFADAAAEMFLR